jgi:hypothetical protein
MSGDPIKFHCDRAAAELDLAMRADHAAAARAHYSLSALHAERAKRLLVATAGCIAANG